MRRQRDWECRICGLVLGLNEFGHHLAKDHVGSAGSTWRCSSDCPFESSSRNDMVEHCLLNGHFAVPPSHDSIFARVLARAIQPPLKQIEWRPPPREYSEYAQNTRRQQPQLMDTLTRPGPIFHHTPSQDPADDAYPVISYAPEFSEEEQASELAEEERPETPKALPRLTSPAKSLRASPTDIENLSYSEEESSPFSRRPPSSASTSSSSNAHKATDLANQAKGSATSSPQTKKQKKQTHTDKCEPIIPRQQAVISVPPPNLLNTPIREYSPTDIDSNQMINYAALDARPTLGKLRCGSCRHSVVVSESKYAARTLANHVLTRAHGAFECLFACSQCPHRASNAKGVMWHVRKEHGGRGGPLFTGEAEEVVEEVRRCFPGFNIDSRIRKCLLECRTH